MFCYILCLYHRQNTVSTVLILMVIFRQITACVTHLNPSSMKICPGCTYRTFHGNYPSFCLIHTIFLVMCIILQQLTAHPLSYRFSHTDDEVRSLELWLWILCCLSHERPDTHTTLSCHTHFGNLT